ncbi:MAG: hypothetical protein QM778_31925 [Myxococcales bacterium]
MSITAVILLKVDSCSPAPQSGMRADLLEDAALLHTGLPFASEPDELLERVRAAVGDDLLAEHEDPRGLFVMPDVAAPRARSYLDVIDEVGEGGSWLPLEQASSYGLPDGLGALGAVLGSMLQNMPESVLEAASAAARGDLAAFSQVSDQVASLMGHGSEGVSLASLARLMGDGRALDPSSPAFQQILHTLEGELERNPEQVARIAEQFFGAPHRDDDER